MCGGLAGVSCEDAGERWEGEASDDDQTARHAALRRAHPSVLQWTVQATRTIGILTHANAEAQSVTFSPVSVTSPFPHAVTRVIIMSSIMERMCADIFQQTGATLRPPMDGQETIPYRNLLPAKDPIHMSLSKQFQAVLSKGWVDSQALHLFDSLLNMGGVFWFTNNLIKVGCPVEGSDGLAITKNIFPLTLLWKGKNSEFQFVLTRTVKLKILVVF